MEYYKKVDGGRVIVGRTGDEMEQFISNRPSVASREYWDYLTSRVCAGVGISKLLVFPWSMQGTVTRADLDSQAAYFRARSAVMARYFTEAYWYVMEWATRNVLEVSDPPEDWRNVRVRAPRSVNVDVGRNAAALIAEYQAGWRSLESICGELGEDWEDVMDQRGAEMQRALAKEKELNLPPGSLINAMLASIQTAQNTANSSKPEPANAEG
jgi:capsid protein